MSDAIIRTERVTKSYTTGRVKTTVLKGISVEVERGSFACIVGPSGHGKSTFLHVVGGLDRPTEGAIFVDGVDITSLDGSALAEFRARKIGFVFQFFNLLQNLTAEENVQAAMMFTGVPARVQRERAGELLSLVGLADRRKAKPSELSGGQQQRVAIARALANDPEILLMDEPTGNLDSESEEEVLDQIRGIHQRGRTVVIITHDADLAGSAEVVFVLKDGGLTRALVRAGRSDPLAARR